MRILRLADLFLVFSLEFLSSELSLAENYTIAPWLAVCHQLIFGLTLLNLIGEDVKMNGLNMS